MSITDDELALVSSRLVNFIYTICHKKDVQIEVSEQRTTEVIQHFYRDLEKLEFQHQGSSISTNKRIAGLVFWMRRIKPIVFACKVNSEHEICDINEQVAVWASHCLLIYYSVGNHSPEPMKSANISGKRSQFTDYLYHYWRINGSFNYTSLVYSLRYRNFSPHHLAILFDSITTGFVLKHTIFQPG